MYALVATVTLAAAPLAGQTSVPALPRGPAITHQDLATLAIATVAAGVLVPFDVRIVRSGQRPGLHSSRVVREAAAALRVLGDPGTLVLGGATYGVGLLVDRHATAAVGLHTVGAIVTGGVATGVMKIVLGRARPYVTADSDATDFAFARGLRGSEYQSLPSGHATAAFAFAGALAAEGRQRWRTTNRVTGPVGYAFASFVAASRVYHDRHWASDVVLGSGIGAVVGAAVVRYARAHPDNTVDRHLLRGVAPPPPLVSWSLRF